MVKVEWPRTNSIHASASSPPAPCVCSFMRTLALPQAIKQWPPTSLREKFVEIGVKVVRHAPCAVLQMAEVAVPREFFQKETATDRGTAVTTTTSACVRHRWPSVQRLPIGGVRENTRKKMCRWGPRPMFGLPELAVAVRVSLLPCGKAGKTRVFTSPREPPWECRLTWRWPHRP